jgi:hypothetical protein
LLLLEPSSPPEEHETNIVEILRIVKNNRYVNFFTITIKDIMVQISISAPIIEL